MFPNSADYSQSDDFDEYDKEYTTQGYSMSNETVKVNLWQLHSTEKAYLFSTKPDDKLNSFWLPCSQIEHISRTPSKDGGPPHCLVTLPIWLAEKHDLY